MPRNTGKKSKARPKIKSVRKTTSPKKKSTISSVRSRTNALPERARRINLALEAANMAVWEWDLSDDTVFWSANAHRIFGLSAEGFDGTFETYMNLIHPDDRQKVISSFNEALSGTGVTHLDHRLIWPDGSVQWVETTGKVTASKRGKPLTITGTIQEVSQKKLVEREREDWKTRHELVTSSAGLVIYDYDIPSGNIVWSGNSKEVLGFKPKELGNIDRWIALIHPEDRGEAFALLEKAEKDLLPYDVYYRFRKKSGAYIHMHDRGFFVADKKGHAVRMLGMMADVSARVQAEKTIRENSLFRESLESTMPGILYVFDVIQKKLVYANNGLEKYLGYTFGELRSAGTVFVEKIVHPEDVSNIATWDKEPVGIVKESQYRILNKGGTYKWFSSQATPFKHDDNGRVIHVIGIAQDITSGIEAIEKLNRSEQSYRELFDTVGEGIFILGQDGIFLDVNMGACMMFAYEKSELTGAGLLFISAEGRNDHGLLDNKIATALRGGTEDFEFWGKKKNGEIFLLELKLKGGTYFGQQIVIITAWDVSQRLLAEQAVRDSEQRFRILQKASFGGIGLHDQGFIIDCNQGLSNITGYSYEELVGRNGLELIAPEWRTFVLEKIKEGYDKPYDAEGVRKDGTRYFLEIHGKNIPYQGRTIRVTEFRDISDRKKTEQKIREQNTSLLALTQELVRKNSQLEEFTQIVSHNLRAPVGNIITLVNLYENALTDEERQEYFSLLKDSSSTTMVMLNDVNEVLKIKQNKNIEREELRFEDVLQKVCTLLTAKISELSAGISVDFSQCPSLHYSRVYLESILLNLLDNALKYSSPERKPEIRFKTYRDQNGSPVLEVCDNGLGLNLHRYGNHVFKLRKTFHRHPESRGIGLFMIRSQIETMGGEISITSTENEGSCFLINFNKYQPDAV